MRFMVMVKANEQSEENVAPSTEDLDAMSRYNVELVKAGVLLLGPRGEVPRGGRRVGQARPVRG
jgi:hypothetical protein